MVAPKNPVIWPSAFGVAALLAAAAPLLFSGATEMTPGASRRPPWPSHYEGKPLTPLGLSGREALFAQAFPGRVERFSDGSREIIIRWVGEATRRLHPATDCFRGVGFSVAPLPARTGDHGARMSCFAAARRSNRLRVCEYVRDDRGNSWPDVSSWYWSAVFKPNSAGWWSFVIAESYR